MPEGGSLIPEETRRSRAEFIRDTKELSDSEAAQEFFSRLAVNRAQFESAHPFGSEVAPASVIEKRRAQAKSIFQQIRESKWGKPLMGLMFALSGMGQFAFKNMEREDGKPIKEETVEIASDDPGIQYEMKRLVLEELQKNGEITVEYEGRYGRQRWDQLERLAYQDFPTLSSKFEYLHKDETDIIAAYKDPRGRLDNYRTLYVMMAGEFKHSSLPYQFSEKCIEDAVSLIPSLPASEALSVYNSFSQELYQSVGFRAVHEMALGLAQALPAEHPVMKQIEKHAWLSEEAAGWLKPQKENHAYFDQVTGRVRVYHQIGEKMILLDTFPANGGPAKGVAWERGLPAHVAVRTPDGAFQFSRAFEKKSASWPYSWVTDTSPLRWTQDKQNVEYQDEDGTWRRLTGADAEFTVMGAPQKPFKEKKKSSMYNAATERSKDGIKYPAPFTVFPVLDEKGEVVVASDVLDEKGELRATWDLNDFGPRSIQIKDQDGEVMPIFFHSSPTDEGEQQFLNNSHGCIHMKPIDIDIASNYLAKGSLMRISSGEPTKIAQQEKHGETVPTEG